MYHSDTRALWKRFDNDAKRMFEGIFIDKGSQVSINCRKKHWIPSENNMPLKSYCDPLPESDIKEMTEMQKTLHIQFNSITVNGEVMYLRLFAMNSF